MRHSAAAARTALVACAAALAGDANCRATTWDWRTDAPEARSFLGGYVTLP